MAIIYSKESFPWLLSIEEYLQSIEKTLDWESFNQIMNAKYPKSPSEMYADLVGVQEGGSIYTLKRAEPMNIEYIEQISRSSIESPDRSNDRLLVYLTSRQGKEYRIVVDCAEDRVAMEHLKDGRWQTYSNALSGFRYRSSNHPDCEQNWKYDGN